MNKMLWKLFGSRVARRTMEKHTQEGGLLDARLGFALLRDRRIPLATKALALAIGIGATLALVTAEMPLEAILAALIPFFGFLGDAVLDGAEFVVGPALITCLLLPHLAPQALVQQVRAERAGAGAGPVIDVVSSTPHTQAAPRSNRLSLLRR